MKQIHARYLPVLLVAVATAADAQTHQQTKMPIQGAGTMEVTRNSDMKTIEGPAAWFTGKVTITGQFQRNEPSRVGGAIVHFEPGARTAWHKHAGRGRASRGVPGRRSAVVPGGSEALAWCDTHHGDDAHHDPGIARWIASDLDEARLRSTISDRPHKGLSPHSRTSSLRGHTHV